MMKIQVRRCKTCGALGVGPRAVKLWPFEGRMYCRAHYGEPLQWHEQREHVVGGIARMREFEDAVRAFQRGKRPAKPIRWEGFIMECAEMAAHGLVMDDRRIFVHYFARALHAWTLKKLWEV